MGIDRVMFLPIFPWHTYFLFSCEGMYGWLSNCLCFVPMNAFVFELELNI